MLPPFIFRRIKFRYNYTEYLKKLTVLYTAFLALFFIGCSSDGGSAKKETGQNIQAEDRLNETNMALPYGNNMDPCGCNEKARAIVDKAISTRTMFDNINNLKADKVSLKQIRTLAKKYETLLGQCFAENGSSMFIPSDCNDLDALEKKKDSLHSLGIQIQQGANIRL